MYYCHTCSRDIKKKGKKTIKSLKDRTEYVDENNKKNSHKKSTETVKI